MKRYLVALALLLVTALAAGSTGQAHEDWCRAALTRLPVSKHDRTPERAIVHQRNRDLFAVEIAKVSARAPLPPQQWASLLGAQGGIESNFDTEVVAGRCLNHQCDPKKVRGEVLFQSVGAFQQQNVAYVRDIWPTAAGNIPVQVEMADRTLRRSLSRCQRFAQFPAHVFRAYSGGSCSWPVAREAERVATYLRLVATPKQTGGAS